MDKIKTAYELAIRLISLIKTIEKSNDGSKKLTVFKNEKPYDNITIMNDKGFFKVVHSFAGQTITYEKVVRIYSTVKLNFIELMLVFGKSETVRIEVQYRDYNLIHLDCLTIASKFWYPAEQYEIPYWDVSYTIEQFAYCQRCGHPFKTNDGHEDPLCPDCIYELENPEEDY